MAEQRRPGRYPAEFTPACRTPSGPDEEITAKTGEVIYLKAGATGVYYADEDADVVAVTYPPDRKALKKTRRGNELDLLHEVEL